MVGCFRRETGEAEEAEEAVHVYGRRRGRCSGSSCLTARPGSVLIWRRQSAGTAGGGDTGSAFTSLGFTIRVAGKSVSISIKILDYEKGNVTINYNTHGPQSPLDMNNLHSQVTAGIYKTLLCCC